MHLANNKWWFSRQVNDPTLCQAYLGLLSGGSYVVLCNKMSREKLGLLSGWTYYPMATVVCNVERFRYLLELSLLDAQRFLVFKSSELAASCVALARHTLNVSAWPDHVAAQAGYNVDDFKDCLIQLHEIYSEAETNPQQAIRDKYRASR